MDVEDSKQPEGNDVNPHTKKEQPPQETQGNVTNKALREWLCAALASPAAQRRQEAMESEGLYGRPENDEHFE